jgi:hypothetical protein
VRVRAVSPVAHLNVLDLLDYLVAKLALLLRFDLLLLLFVAKFVILRLRLKIFSRLVQPLLLPRLLDRLVISLKFLALDMGEGVKAIF